MSEWNKRLSMSNTDNKGVPNWILFVFFGSLLAGSLYAVYKHGFLGYDRSMDLRTAQGAAYVTPSIMIIPQRTPQAISNGEATYQRACVACHGAQLQGVVGPALIKAQWLHFNNEDKMARMVMRGIGPAESVTGGVMPARGGAPLSDREVWEVIYFISSKNPGSMVQDAVPNE